MERNGSEKFMVVSLRAYEGERVGVRESLRSHHGQTEARGLKGEGKNETYFAAQASFGRPKLDQERKVIAGRPRRRY